MELAWTFKLFPQVENIAPGIAQSHGQAALCRCGGDVADLDLARVKPCSNDMVRAGSSYRFWGRRGIAKGYP